MERGGAELVAQRIADELSSRGHDVFVLSTMEFSGLGSLRARPVEHYIERVYRFYPLNIYHAANASSIPFPIRLLWHLIDLSGPYPHKLIDRLIQKEEPDVVLTHNLKGLGVRAAKCIQESGVLHIHTLHDVQLSIPSGVLVYGQEKTGLNTGPWRRWYEKMAMRSLGTPDLIISPSNFLADFYKERGFFSSSKIEILPNPAPIQRGNLQRRMSVDHAIRFLFVGQLERHKGVEVLLDAVKRLRFPFELHIAGDGSLAGEIVRSAELDSRIFFHGFISLEHIRKLMVKADCVVLPSLCYENSPTVIYEAFQAGLPVLASRIGGIPELVREDENGLLFEPGSTDALVSAMERFASARVKFFQQQTKIREQAEQYSIGRYVNRLESYFK